MIRVGGETNACEMENSGAAFIYRTEIIIVKNPAAEGIVPKLNRFLRRIGEHAQVSEAESRVKVYVHTAFPDVVIQKVCKLGIIEKIEVENIRLSGCIDSAGRGDI